MFEMKDSIKKNMNAKEPRWEVNWEINSFRFGNETHEDQEWCLRVDFFYQKWNLKWKKFCKSEGTSCNRLKTDNLAWKTSSKTSQQKVVCFTFKTTLCLSTAPMLLKNTSTSCVRTKKYFRTYSTKKPAFYRKSNKSGVFLRKKPQSKPKYIRTFIDQCAFLPFNVLRWNFILQLMFIRFGEYFHFLPPSACHWNTKSDTREKCFILFPFE